jgi:hypothetical protein
MIQPGTHPDAGILTAFAEQLITDTEREEILTHMAVCSRCREVVFLAQGAMGTEEPVRSAAEIPHRKASTSWFTAWRWSWVPVAALAGVVGFAVVRHMNRPSLSETRMALNAPPAQMTESTASLKSAPTSNAPQQPSRAEAKKKLAAPERSDRDAGRDRQSIDKKDQFAARKKDEVPKETDSLASANSGLSASLAHGALDARAKSSGLGGPMAQNQVQQQNNAQLQQNHAQLQQNHANEDRQAKASADSANKPASSAIQPGTASQTVTVEAGGGPVPVSPAPSAAPVVTTMQTESETVAVSGKSLAKLKAKTSALPSNLGLVSQAALGKKTIALDTAGSAFASDDAGKHWAPVKMEWTGRAVIVKAEPPSGLFTGNVLSQPAAHFELLTDKLETWISTDGKSWRLKAPDSN